MGPICYGFPRIPCHTRSDRRLPAGHGRRREPGATPKKWHDSPSPWGHAQRPRQCAIRAEHNPCPRMAVSARSCPLLSLGTAAPTCPTLKLSAPYPNSTTADGSARRTSAFRPPPRHLPNRIPIPQWSNPRRRAGKPLSATGAINASLVSAPASTPDKTDSNPTETAKTDTRNVREMSTFPAIYLRPLTAIAQFKRITLRKILRAHV
jgi:hypothetical protein